MKRPDGVSESDFAAALQEFAQAVGKDWVFSRDEDVALYNDSYSFFFGEPDLQYVASGAVAPKTVEEVQAVVRVANKYKIPLYAISTGRNLGYGGSSPTYSGSVIVDLKRMNRVLEVNERESYAILEPGVSFIDLHRYFEQHNHPFMVATPDPGWGSPIGNALDHGTSPVAGENFSMAHGMEVVLANGDVMRTGMGSLPGSRLWANYRYGFGPYLNGIFSQSNFGIVTKMVFWLVRKPELQLSFTVDSNKTEDMQALIDTVQSMRDQGFIHSSSAGSPIRESMSTNDGRQPFGVPEVRTLHARRDGGTPAMWDKLAVDSKIPSIRIGGSARGPASIVNATMEHAREMFAKFPGTTFKISAPQAYSPPRIEFGILGVQPTSHGHNYFSPMFKVTAEDIFGINDVIRNTMLDHDDLDMLANFGWSAGRGTSYPKANMILMEFLVFDDVALNRKRRDLFKALIENCGARGWGEYRTPVAFHTLVHEQYSFGNYSLPRFCEAIKDAIDPNGILSPGKNGIWPKHLRPARDPKTGKMI